MQLSASELARAPEMMELLYAVGDASLEVEIVWLREFDPELELEVDLLRAVDREVELEVCAPEPAEADLVPAATLDDPWFDAFDESVAIEDEAPPTDARRLRRWTRWLRSAA